MSPEILLVAIGCYLFCGIDEQWYKWQTGDYRGGNISYNFEKELSDFTFVPKETTYSKVIEIFGKNFAQQRTHRVIRKQKYDGETYYFNRELHYVYRKVIFLENRAAYFSCKSDLEFSLFFKDNILVFYNIYDSRVNPNTCEDYFGKLNTITDKYWLKYGTSIDNCNKKFYRIFTLYHREEWYNAEDCDFYKDPTYWDDPVYDWRNYFRKKGGMPCGGTIFNSC